MFVSLKTQLNKIKYALVILVKVIKKNVFENFNRLKRLLIVKNKNDNELNNIYE